MVVVREFEIRRVMNRNADPTHCNGWDFVAMNRHVFHRVIPRFVIRGLATHCTPLAARHSDVIHLFGLALRALDQFGERDRLQHLVLLGGHRAPRAHQYSRDGGIAGRGRGQ